MVALLSEDLPLIEVLLFILGEDGKRKVLLRTRSNNPKGRVPRALPVGIYTAPYDMTGKYLFFSLNRDLLIEIAIDELENGDFHHAKTQMAGITPPSGEYVLCLYYKDNSRKHELAAKYRDRSGLKYRYYWKSKSETLAGNLPQL